MKNPQAHRALIALRSLRQIEITNSGGIFVLEDCYRWVIMVLMALVALAGVTRRATAAAEAGGGTGGAEQWGIYEVVLKGPAEGNPFLEVTVGAEFRCGAAVMKVPGFYDGEGTYRIRFSAPSQGAWTYKTASNVAALDGNTGSVKVGKPEAGNHGPLEVYKTFHFQYADGTPYFEIGTTCYAWTHQTADLQEETLKTLASSPFNKIRMCIFPKSYNYNKNDPENYPFVRGADGKFDFTRFDPSNWRHFEHCVGDLEKLGIQADLILFHPYDRWGFATMDKEADDRYLRYAIARLAAYRNVWWSLANEYDFMIPPLKYSSKGNKSLEDFDRFFSILQKEDPYNRMRGIHNANKIYDDTKAWVTHASIQNADLRQVMAWREKYQKPVVVDECQYEGNIPDGWGHLTGQRMVQQFWVGTVSGGYVGHGETFKDPNDVLWWSKGGVLHGESPGRIAYLKKIMEALPYTDMVPSRPDTNVLVLAKAGTAYLAYALAAGPMKLELAAGHTYEVEAIDTWNMKEIPLKEATGGTLTVEAPGADYLVRVVVKP